MNLCSKQAQEGWPGCLQGHVELRFKEALDPKKVQIIIFRITVRPGSVDGTASGPKGGLA